MTDGPSARLADAGLALPEPQQRLGSYLPGRIVGDLLFLSGQTPQRDGTPTVRGTVGDTVDISVAAEAAGLAALNALALARGILGSLDRVECVVRLTGYVVTGPGFERHPEVLDGASAVLETAFGDDGRHARSAIGVVSLPQGAPVELDLVLQIRPDDQKWGS